MKTFLLLLIGIGILLIVAIRRKKEWLLNFVMKSILGMIAIYFMNMVLKLFGIPLDIGINTMTVLTTGILGIPGLVALYGMGFYYLL